MSQYAGRSAPRCPQRTAWPVVGRGALHHCGPSLGASTGHPGNPVNTLNTSFASSPHPIGRISASTIPALFSMRRAGCGRYANSAHRGGCGPGSGTALAMRSSQRPHRDLSHHVPAEEPGIEGVHVVRRDHEQCLWGEAGTRCDGSVLSAPVERDRQHHETRAAGPNDVRFEQGGGHRDPLDLRGHSLSQSMNGTTHSSMEHPATARLNPRRRRNRPRRRAACQLRDDCRPLSTTDPTARVRPQRRPWDSSGAVARSTPMHRPLRRPQPITEHAPQFP